ncbi:MAG TPA: nucleotide exchange factor GrpE [Treponemataceae bacterium]|nr:nucleotide exchange factor GrpE [Treponemataceae bacterium]
MKGTDKKAKEQQGAEKEACCTEEEIQEVEKNQSSETSENMKTNEEAGQSEEKTPQDIIIELQKENTELKDQYLRKLADFDNYRKRMIKEKQDAIDYANTNLLKDLISTLDDFDRALGSVTQPDGTEEINPVVQGIAMINKQLRAMLESKYNLLAYGEKGDAFDHDKHEAIATSQAAVAEPVCAEVYLKGYMLKDRVIRAAKVMVHMPDGSVSAE